MVINHNISAMSANRYMGVNKGNQAKSIEKLSSGLRINRAGDDAAGLSISEKMRGQIRGLQQGSRNAQDGISLIQTAEGALNETHSILQRMRELSVQASNDTNKNEDRDMINKEFEALQSEITRIGNETEFNKQSLLSGSAANLSFQVGANKNQVIEITIKDMRAAALDVNKSAVNIKNKSAAQSAIDAIDKAIDKVSQQRADLGATQNRLEHTITTSDNTAENLQSAESRIRDVDMASEMMKYTSSNILAQAAQAMLTQANQAPQSALSLLQ